MIVAEYFKVPNKILINSVGNTINHKNSQGNYINDFNKFGKERLNKRNAMLLLLALYGLRPDKNGLVVNVDLEKIADFLHLKKRTVRENLERLAHRDYIAYTKSYVDLHLFNVIIKDYSHMWEPASKGGRGYITASRKMLEEMTNLKSTDEIRLLLRTSYELSTDNPLGEKTENLPLNEIKQWFKNRQSKNSVRNLFRSLEQFVDVTSDKYFVTFKQKSPFSNGQYSQDRKHFSSKIREFFEECAVGYDGDKRLKPTYHTDKKFINDVANIALSYGIDMVLEACRIFNIQYIKEELTFGVGNAAALIRTMTESVHRAFSYTTE